MKNKELCIRLSSTKINKEKTRVYNENKTQKSRERLAVYCISLLSDIPLAYCQIYRLYIRMLPDIPLVYPYVAGYTACILACLQLFHSKMRTARIKFFHVNFTPNAHKI
jgi:hypothetical protein